MLRLDLLLLLTLSTSAYTTLFDYSRSSDDINLLHFKCRESSTFQLIEGADFFLNGQQIPDGLVSLSVDSDFQVAYRISQEYDGNYSCGIGQTESDEELLLASPAVDPSIPTDYYVTTGESATLVCPILPGALPQYYSIQWGKDFVYVSPSENILIESNGNRFVLCIVTANASHNGTYICEITVNAPDDGNNPIYEDTVVHLHVSNIGELL